MGSCWSSPIPFYWADKVALIGVCVGGGGIAAPHGVSGEAKMTPGILLVVKLGGPGRPEDLLSWVGGKTLAG